MIIIMTHLLNTYYAPGTVLRTLYMLFQLILTIA